MISRVRALIAGAGYDSQEPVIAGVHGRGRPPVFAAQGVTGAGEPVGPATLAYAALVFRTYQGLRDHDSLSWFA